jgi:hypothetical protein
MSMQGTVKSLSTISIHLDVISSYLVPLAVLILHHLQRARECFCSMSTSTSSSPSSPRSKLTGYLHPPSPRPSHDPSRSSNTSAFHLGDSTGSTSALPKMPRRPHRGLTYEEVKDCGIISNEELSPIFDDIPLEEKEIKKMPRKVRL